LKKYKRPNICTIAFQEEVEKDKHVGSLFKWIIALKLLSLEKDTNI
jgi:hypothetical protein